MNGKICVLTALVICIGLLLTGFSAGQLDSSVTISFIGVVQQTSAEPYSYIISALGPNYQMINGTTGQIVFQSTNSSKVFSNVVGNCSVGSSIDVKSGEYAVNTMWTMINTNNITLNFENGAELVAGNNLNTPVLFLYQSNNVLINGITINGNSAGQTLTGSTWSYNGGPISTDGILISGSNDQVDNATIYNCRVIGVNIFDFNGQPTVTHSGVVNSKIFNCGWNGVNAGTENSLSCYLKETEIYGCSDVGVSTSGKNTLISDNYIHDMNGSTGDSGSKWGIGIEGGSNDLITRNTVTRSCYGIQNSGWNNCTISENTIICGSPSYNGYSFGITLANYFSPQCNYNTVSDNHITGAYWNSTTWAGGIGIQCIGAMYNNISGNVISFCDFSGISVDSKSSNNSITGNIVSDTLSGGNGIVGSSGIEIAGSSNYVSQNQAFDDRLGSSRTQEYGIVMDPGAHNNVLIGNNLNNNIGHQIYDTNVPENTKINNIGYNPIGPIENPISGSTAYLVDSGSNFTLSSGRVYTNTGSPKVLNISLGIVSIVTKNGVTLFTNTNCIVTLQPDDTFSITYTVVPTFNVIGL